MEFDTLNSTEAASEGLRIGAHLLTLPHHSNNVQSGFFGRTQILARVRAAIRFCHCVTLVGRGGIGKTRLAQEVIEEPTPLIALNNVRTSAQLIDALRLGLDLNLPAAVRSGEDSLPIIARHLPELLILDNAELLDQSAIDLLGKLFLLTASRFLITSRKALDLPDELVLLLTPLSPEESGLLAAYLAVKAGKGAISVAQEILVAGNPLDIENAVLGGIIGKLPASQKALLAGLAVFVHSWSLADAEGVLGALDSLDFDMLADTGLVLRIPGSGRWGMRPPTRDRARALGAADGLAGVHATYFEALALKGDPDVLEPSAHELVAALDFLLQTGEHMRAARIAVALTPWAAQSGRLDTAEGWLRSAGTSTLPPRLAAEVMDALGRLLLSAGRYSEALVPLVHARDYWAREGNLPLAGRASGNLGNCCRFLGDLKAAEVHCRRAVEVFRHQADSQRLSSALNNLGQVLGQALRWQEAADAQREALALDQQESERARRYLNLAETLLHLGETDEARHASEAALIFLPQRNQKAKAETLLALLSDSPNLGLAWAECQKLGVAAPFWKETIALIESKLDISLR